MQVLGYFFAVVIGLVMGLIGGGGSILSVPVFAYIFNIDAITATTLSLFVVGVTSSAGSVGFLRQGSINFKTALLFGLPSVLGILFSRRVDRKSTRLNSSHVKISYAVFCLKKKKRKT